MRPDEIDRITPTIRPDLPIAGYQDWRDLLFLHWTVPVAALRPLVPEPLTIDTFDGVAYVGLVPFWVTGARPPLTPRALGLRFLETNVRTYVHLDGRDPGVFFFSLDASSWAAVLGARAGFGLPYFPARMRMRREGPLVEYRSRRLVGGSARSLAAFEPGAYLGPSRPGTLKHFLVERYLLYVERVGRLWVGQVHHAPYPVQLATLRRLGDELIGAAGLPEPTEPPPLVHYASGVDVEIFPLRLTRGPAEDARRRAAR